MTATAEPKRTPQPKAPEPTQALYVHCGKCQHEWFVAWLPLPVDAFVRLCRGMKCPLCRSKQVMQGLLPRPTEQGDALGWLSNGDTGVSSETIWFVMMGRPARSRFVPDVPRDPSDFGRCYRLLQVMPGWRARLPEVALAHPTRWPAFVEHWDELSTLYEQVIGPSGKGWDMTASRALHARMQQLEGTTP